MQNHTCKHCSILFIAIFKCQCGGTKSICCVKSGKEEERKRERERFYVGNK